MVNLEFKIIKPKFKPNIRNSIWSKFSKTNNQHGLPDEINKLKITASFTINYIRLSLVIFLTSSGYVTAILMHINVAY